MRGAALARCSRGARAVSLLPMQGSPALAFVKSEFRKAMTTAGETWVLMLVKPWRAKGSQRHAQGHEHICYGPHNPTTGNSLAPAPTLPLVSSPARLDVAEAHAELLVAGGEVQEGVAGDGDGAAVGRRRGRRGGLAAGSCQESRGGWASQQRQRVRPWPRQLGLRRIAPGLRPLHALRSRTALRCESCGRWQPGPAQPAHRPSRTAARHAPHANSAQYGRCRRTARLHAERLRRAVLR